MKNTINKMILIGLIILANGLHQNIHGQKRAAINGNRIISSLDMTFWGPQISLAYDFYTKKGVFYGLSISQINGFKKYENDNTLYLTANNARTNLSLRYSRVFYQTNRINSFYILKGGISYDAVLSNRSPSFIPSLNIGGGIDIKLQENSGIRIEAGIGPPYFASLGYFFTVK